MINNPSFFNINAWYFKEIIIPRSVYVNLFMNRFFKPYTAFMVFVAYKNPAKAGKIKLLLLGCYTGTRIGIYSLFNGFYQFTVIVEFSFSL